MFNPTLIVIEAFIRELRTMYERTYGILEPNYPGILNFVAQLALETIATSDAVYHDVNHTIMVTLVGQEILRGRHISVGRVTPHDWLHFIVSLLGHDIGYVRGICRGDGDGSYVINLTGDKVTLPEGATDASMAPFSTDQGLADSPLRYSRVPVFKNSVTCSRVIKRNTDASELHL